MDTKFTIKNFRVFDENGVALDLKPLTILTGCNSSGKSSIARSTLLLNSFLVQIKKSMDNRDSVDFNNYKIDLRLILTIFLEHLTMLYLKVRRCAK